jgi:hypothetical protein
MLFSAVQCLLGTLLSVAISHTAWAFQAELASAQDLLAQGENHSAYSQLRATELEHSGKPEFDYWLGVAALRAGESSHALIVLDRAILRQPNHAGARMERVAALVQLDQLGTAEQEIEQLQALSPPPDAQATIARFQAMIEQRRQAKNGPQHQGLLGVDIGYDSNPQRFPSEIQYSDIVETLIKSEALKLENEPKRNASTYQRWQGSYQGIFPIATQSRWLITATGQAQRYTEEAAQVYDLTLGQAQLGYQRDLAAQRIWTLRSSVLQGWSGLQQNRLLTRWGISSDLQHPIGLDSKLTWQLDLQDVHFGSSNNDYTSSRFGVKILTRHQAFRTRLNAQIEHEWADNSRDGGDLIQLNLGAGVDYPLSDQHLVRADITQLFRSYLNDSYQDESNIIDLSDKRQDRIWQVRLAWLYQLNSEWLLEASADVEHRSSSVEFFDTQRYQTQLALRYLF